MMTDVHVDIPGLVQSFKEGFQDGENRREFTALLDEYAEVRRTELQTLTSLLFLTIVTFPESSLGPVDLAPRGFLFSVVIMF